MAVVKGIKEKVHLPLYDAISVKRGEQLGEKHTSNVLRFFQDVTGKTKLETNMQAASLLPHWNTFEARAMRVVLSDLAPQFPDKITVNVSGLGIVDAQGNEIPISNNDSNQKTTTLQNLSLGSYVKLSRQVEESPGCSAKLSQSDVSALSTKTSSVTTNPALAKDEFLAIDRKALDKIRDELAAEGVGLPPAEQVMPGNGHGDVISRFIYNTVTTLYVGEKIMIQMPTWFFPAGAGPYAEDGQVITHGYPSPEATFRFAEPIQIDTQQNFRVEIEIPEGEELAVLQNQYGPHFIWVVIDGFMTRDVQGAPAAGKGREENGTLHDRRSVMAVVKGIKERVHLPLYDALSVRPGQQLREVESSSVLKFFVNVQSKTKLETNMKASSLLPHWNTFEARALRVVVSDLAPRFPAEVERCLYDAGADGDCREVLESCLRDLDRILGDRPLPPPQVRQLLRKLGNTLSKIDATGQYGLEPLESFLGTAALRDGLRIQAELAEVKDVLLDVLTRTKVKGSGALEELRQTLADAGDLTGAKALPGKLDKAVAALESARRTASQVKRLKSLDLAPLEPANWGWPGPLEALRDKLSQASSELGDNGREVCVPANALRRALEEKLDVGAVPSTQQLDGDPAQIFATLVYNSVTSLFVGEKVMIQMPTWFFPAGAGPYSEDGGQVTHGVPSPEATFRFAEPIHIDTQQNFRVEIEVPERDVLDEIQRIYGPFVIWVVVDGYMVRDVQ